MSVLSQRNVDEVRLERASLWLSSSAGIGEVAFSLEEAQPEFEVTLALKGLEGLEARVGERALEKEALRPEGEPGAYRFRLDVPAHTRAEVRFVDFYR